MTSLTWLADALRDEGCDVIEEGDWEHRGRDGSFDPYGVLWHHTGTTTSSSNPFPTKNTLINGRPDLAGPLCQVGIDYNGGCHVIAAGRANHAGACNGFGPFSSAQDGNAQLVGFEIDYDGTQPMSAAQKDAATRCSAAVLKRFKRNEEYAARHAETSTTGKWDTGGLTGDQLRALIKDYLANGPKDDDMPEYVHVAHNKQQALSEGVWHYISWDDIIDGADVVADGSSSIGIPGRKYSATLLAQITGPQTGPSTIRTRVIEGDTDGKGDAFQILEAAANIEHPLTSGDTSIAETRHGYCNKNSGDSTRRLRWQIYLPYPGASLVKADLVLFYW